MFCNSFVYADLLTYKITPIIDKKKSQLELFQSSGDYFYLCEFFPISVSSNSYDVQTVIFFYNKPD